MQQEKPKDQKEPLSLLSFPDFCKEFAKYDEAQQQQYCADIANTDLNQVLLYALRAHNSKLLTLLFEEYAHKINGEFEAFLHLDDEVDETTMASRYIIFDAKDDKGNTLLHYAVMYHQSHLINAFMRISPNLVTVKNQQGYTPLDFAALSGSDLLEEVIHPDFGGFESQFKIPKAIIEQASTYAQRTFDFEEKYGRKTSPISRGKQRHDFFIKKSEAINEIQSKDSWQNQALQTATQGSVRSGSWWDQILQKVNTLKQLPNKFLVYTQNQDELSAIKLQQNSEIFKIFTLDQLEKLLVALPTAKVLEFLTQPKVNKPFNLRAMNIVLKELLARAQHQPAGLTVENANTLIEKINQFTVINLASLQQLCELTIKALATGISDDATTKLLKQLEQLHEGMPVDKPIDRVLQRQLKTFIDMVTQQFPVKTFAVSQSSQELPTESVDSLSVSDLSPKTEAKYRPLESKEEVAVPLTYKEKMQRAALMRNVDEFELVGEQWLYSISQAESVTDEDKEYLQTVKAKIALEYNLYNTDTTDSTAKEARLPTVLQIKDPVAPLSSSRFLGGRRPSLPLAVCGEQPLLPDAPSLVRARSL